MFYIDLLGYLGIIINLVSMGMKSTLHLRSLSTLANAIYIIYGVLIAAPPVYIGCSIAVILHLYHIRKLLKA